MQLADSVTPDQAAALVALRENMRQRGSLALGKVLGSDTVQKLATGNMLQGIGTSKPMTGGEMLMHGVTSVGNPMVGLPALAVQGLRRVIGSQTAKGEAMVRQALLDRMTNPQLAAPALQAAAAPVP